MPWSPALLAASRLYIDAPPLLWSTALLAAVSAVAGNGDVLWRTYRYNGRGRRSLLTTSDCVFCGSMASRAGLLGRATSMHPPDTPPWCKGNCGLRANTRDDIKKAFPGWCCGCCCLLHSDPTSSSKPHGWRCVKFRGNRGHPTGDEMHALVEQERARLGIGKDQMLQFALRLVAENADAPNADKMVAAVERMGIEGVVFEAHTAPQEISTEPTLALEDDPWPNQEWFDDPDWKEFDDADCKDWTASSSTSSSSGAVPKWGAKKRSRSRSEDRPDNKLQTS